MTFKYSEDPDVDYLTRTLVRGIIAILAFGLIIVGLLTLMGVN